jgi:hypothetical protein
MWKGVLGGQLSGALSDEARRFTPADLSPLR